MGKDLKGKELGTGLSQRKDGRYCGRYTDRFGQRVTIYDKNLAEIKKKFRAEQVANDTGTNVINNNITLDEWFEYWMETYKSGKRNTTQHNIRYEYGYVKDTLGKLKLSELNIATIQREINKLRTNSIQTLTLRVLKDMLERAVENEVLIKNPAKKVQITKSDKETEIRVLTQKEQQIFLEKAKDYKCYLGIVIMLRTGMRIGELLGLTWDNIDFKNRVIHVEKTLSIVYVNKKRTFEFHPPKTKSSKRTIPMTSDVCTAFKRQFVNKQDIIKAGIQPLKGFENLVFVTRSNWPVDMSTFRSSTKTISLMINEEHPELNFKPVHPHTLRHTFATRWIEEKGDIKVLQQILGHSSAKMTMDIYCHTTPDMIISEIEKMEKNCIAL